MDVNILLPLYHKAEFTYAWPFESNAPSLGQWVQVDFRGQLHQGIVWDIGASLQGRYKIKPVHQVLPWPSLLSSVMDWIRWVSSYHVIPIGQVFKMLMGSITFPNRQSLVPLADGVLGSSYSNPRPHSLVLSSDQQQIASTFSSWAHQFGVHVLHGVTGSGKTEIYFDWIEKTLNQKQQVLVMVPEIGLSSVWSERFMHYFGFAPRLWNSSETLKSRRQNWLSALFGHEGVWVGTRSSVFLPFQRLGLVVVDEEHDPSFKQDDSPMYSARDIGVMRGKFQNIPIVLASATPSLETMVNCEQEKYHKFTLSHRYHDVPLPQVHLVDMRKFPPVKGQWISPIMIEAMEKKLSYGEQSMLFLNRRGYAPLTLCRRCGHRFECKNCSSWLVEHREKKRLQCHHCGFHQPKPPQCTECGSDSLAACGPGVERLQEEIHAKFPDAKQILVSGDDHDLESAVQSIRRGEFDIIIATQILAKGYHFPNLTLVGIVDADMGLENLDLRASEKNFQLLQQVAGRSGREGKQGEVLIQTHWPDHPLMQHLSRNDFEGFVAYESRNRQQSGNPPYSRLISITLSSTDESVVLKTAGALAAQQPKMEGVEIWGPIPALMTKVKRRYRHRFIVRSPKNIRIQPHLIQWIESIAVPNKVKIQIEVDPYSFW